MSHEEDLKRIHGPLENRLRSEIAVKFVKKVDVVLYVVEADRAWNVDFLDQFSDVGVSGCH